MGAVLTYTLFCVVVIVDVVAGFVAGYPVNVVGTLGGLGGPVRRHRGGAAPVPEPPRVTDP